MKRSYKESLILCIVPLVSFFLFAMTLKSSLPIYLIGQLFGILFFFQAFILLHELGHNSFFPSKNLNRLVGTVLSFFVFIPFYNWKRVHALHHKWTGYRDIDPTTEKTFATRLSPMTTRVVDFCWKYSIPVFTIGYRFGIYWSRDKLRRYLSHDEYRLCLGSMIIYILLYLLLLFFFPLIVLYSLPAILLSFSLTDLLSISQHSHVAMKHSNGEDVSPLKYRDQSQYSRSIKMGVFLERFILFYMNRHCEHHAYPGLPCYRLNKIKVDEGVYKDLSSWVFKVKSIRGSKFIFETGIYDV